MRHGRLERLKMEGEREREREWGGERRGSERVLYLSLSLALFFCRQSRQRVKTNGLHNSFLPLAQREDDGSSSILSVCVCGCVSLTSSSSSASLLSGYQQLPSRRRKKNSSPIFSSPSLFVFVVVVAMYSNFKEKAIGECRRRFRLSHVLRLAERMK